QPQHAGCVRAGDTQDRVHSARQRRLAVHGWRKHERAGRKSAAGRFRRGSDAPEPAQNILDATWRRWPRFGTGGDQEVFGAVSPQAGPDRQGRWNTGLRLRPAELRRPRPAVLWQLWNVRTRAGLHYGEWT